MGRVSNGSEGADQTEGTFPIRYATIHGHRIGYRRGGIGPVLLLLHGIAGSSQTWIPAMELLQADYTVVAPDFLGHGHSAKANGGLLAGKLRQLDARPSGCAGHRADHGDRPIVRWRRCRAVRIPVSGSMRGTRAGRCRRSRARGELDPATRYPAGRRVRDACPLPNFRPPVGRQRGPTRRPGRHPECAHEGGLAFLPLADRR